MKKIFFILVLAAVLFPYSSHAQVDARCWYKDDCLAARKELDSDLTPEEQAKGFVTDGTAKELCKGVYQTEERPIGFCLPPTTAKTKIAIGGQTEFTGLAEFIAFIYKYGMGLASVLSVLVLIFAGVQWIISGGNAETISKAKHKIVGAVIGMIILAAAYTILYTVNPDLVNLRPPNAWMINTLNLPTNPSCQAMTKGEKISPTPAHRTGEKIDTEELKKRFSSISTWVSPTTSQTGAEKPNAPPAHCGQNYFVQGTGALTCNGTFCPKNAAGTSQVCYDKFQNGLMDCHPANLVGEIYSTSIEANLLNQNTPGNLIGTFLVAAGWEWIWVNQPELWAVCINGKHQDIDAENNDPDEDQFLNKTKLRQTYQFTISNEELEERSVEWCKDQNSELKGFVIDFDINREGNLGDEEHFIGRKADGSAAFDLGDKQYDDIQCVLQAAPAVHFFTFEEIKNGKKFDVDVNQITRLADTQADYESVKDNDEETHIMRKNTYKFGTVQLCF